MPRAFSCFWVHLGHTTRRFHLTLRSSRCAKRKSGLLARTQTQGGGNCANALTAAARLGLAPALVSKLGGDAVGDGIVEELNADGVATDLVLRQPGAPSPFTYIIVDAEGDGISMTGKCLSSCTT